MTLEILDGKGIMLRFGEEMWESQANGELSNFIIDNRDFVMTRFLNSNPDIMGLIIDVALFKDNELYNELIDRIVNEDIDGLYNDFYERINPPTETDDSRMASLEEELRLQKEENTNLLVKMSIIEDVVVTMMDEKFGE